MKERTGTKSKGGEGAGRCRRMDIHRGRVQQCRTQHEFYLNKYSIPYVISLIPKSRIIEPT